MGVEIVEAPADAVERLASMHILEGLTEGDLRAVADTTTWWSVDSGTTLFHQGDHAAAACLVSVGRFEVVRDGRTIGHREPGDVLGETGLLGSGARTADANSVRDCLVAVVQAADLVSLAETHPAVALALTRTVAGHLRSGRSPGTRLHPPRLVGMIAASQGVDVAAFARRVAAARPPSTYVTAIDAPMIEAWAATGSSTAITARLMDVESRSDLVLVEIPDEGPTADRLARQMDLLLAVGRLEMPPPEPVVRRLESTGRPLHLVIARRTSARPAIGPWRAEVALLGRHAPVLHLADGSVADAARLARRLTGRSVGIVLGGGGARGFAHIGAVRALREAGIPIDRVAGSSMGAIIGAQVALGWSAERMLEENRRGWSRRLLGEPGWNGLSLAKGERAFALLGSFFEDATIEELPLEFFCTTADLTTCRLNIADRGPVAAWVGASAAVPGLLPPFVDTEGHLHVDGGILDNLPTAPMRSRVAGPVVGVDVCSTHAGMRAAAAPREYGLTPLRRRRGAGWGGGDAPSIVEVLNRSNLMASMWSWEQSREHADLCLTPDTGPHGFTSFDRVEDLVELGYHSTVAQLEGFDLGLLTPGPPATGAPSPSGAAGSGG